MKKGFATRCILVLLSISLALLFTPVVSAAKDAKPIVWKIQTPWPSSIWTHKSAEVWAKDVEDLTDGQLKIDLYCAGEIVPAFEIFDAVRVGTLDAGLTWSGYNIGKYPSLTLFASTPGFLDLLGFWTWIHVGGGLDLWQEVYGDVVKVFCWGMTWAETGGWSNKKIETLDDFKGVKYRTSLIWGEILSEAGAAVITLPGGDVVPSLQRGTLDAAEFAGPDTDYMVGFQDVAKYNYYPGLHQMNCAMELIINPKKWKELPDHLKKMVRAANDMNVTHALTQYILADLKAIDKIKATGTTILKFPVEMQKEILQRFIDKYDSQKDPMFQKVWKSQKDFMRLYLPYMELQKVEAQVDIPK